MSWVRIDDKAWSHPKLSALSPRALRLWLFGLCWCNQYETDGAIPRSRLAALGGTKVSAAELVSANLWEPSHDGWTVHDYLAYQPSKAQRESDRNSAKSRVTEFRSRSRNGVTGGAVTPAVTPAVTAMKRQCNTCPDPDPDPDPDPKAAEDGSKDLTSNARSNERANYYSGGSGSGSSEKLQAQPQTAVRTHGAAPVASTTQTRATGTATAPQSIPRKPVGDPWSMRAPSSTEEALGWPLKERSQACLQFGHSADWACPQHWPEVVAVADALAEATGKPRLPLGAQSRDSGVRAVLGLFADGVELDVLLEALKHAKTDEWFRRGRHGLSSLTLEVYRRLASGPTTPVRQETATEELQRKLRERSEKVASSGRA